MGNEKLSPLMSSSIAENPCTCLHAVLERRDDPQRWCRQRL